MELPASLRPPYERCPGIIHRGALPQVEQCQPQEVSGGGASAEVDLLARQVHHRWPRSGDAGSRKKPDGGHML
jgi:hypothetical protein